MHGAKEPPCLTARAADGAWFQYRGLVLTCRRAQGPHAPPAIDARAECLPAPPTGDERRRQASVNNKPTHGIGSPCHPFSVAVHDSHAAPVLPMRKIVKFEEIGNSASAGRRRHSMPNATNPVEPSPCSACRAQCRRHRHPVGEQPSMGSALQIPERGLQKRRP